MAKVNINEEQLKSIISESVKKVLSECVNEGLFGGITNAIMRRTQDFKVDRYIKSIGGGRYAYSSNNNCYDYIAKNGKRYPTGIGYGRVLYAGDKVSEKEKEEAIRQLKNWDSSHSSAIESRIRDKNFKYTSSSTSSNTTPNYDYHKVNGNTVDLNNVNNAGFKAKQQSRFK